MEERFETFTVLMAKIRRNVQRLKNGEVAEYNLKSPHVSCLYYLNKHESLTATELCEFCSEDKAAISRSIVQLEKEGYVLHKKNKGKAYKAGISLTESGKVVAEQITQKIDHYIGIIGDGLTERERFVFYKGLRRTSKNLEQICQSFDDEGQK